MIIFLIITEAIANAILHGRATDIAVECKRNHDNIIVEIIDNGRGFDITSVTENYRAARKSLAVQTGIMTLDERAQKLLNALPIEWYRTGLDGRGVHLIWQVPVLPLEKHKCIDQELN